MRNSKESDADAQCPNCLALAASEKALRDDCAIYNGLRENAEAERDSLRERAREAEMLVATYKGSAAGFMDVVHSAGHTTVHELVAERDALKAQLAEARGKALEEAAQVCDAALDHPCKDFGYQEGWRDAADILGQRIRALSTPAAKEGSEA